MKGYSLFFLINLITRSPVTAIILAFILYFIIDRYYLGLLSGLSNMLKTNSEIRINLDTLSLNPQNAGAALKFRYTVF